MTARSIRAAAAAVCAALAATASSRAADDVAVFHYWTAESERAAVDVFRDAAARAGLRLVDDGLVGKIGNDGVVVFIHDSIRSGLAPPATLALVTPELRRYMRDGLLLDITDVAAAGEWRRRVQPAFIRDACVVDGRTYCAPVTGHAENWLWLNGAVFDRAGVPRPRNWADFVAAMPDLAAAGTPPLAVGDEEWQVKVLFDSLFSGLVDPALWRRIFDAQDRDAAASAQTLAVFDAFATARTFADPDAPRHWDAVVAHVAAGEAAGMFMGDWALPEFARLGLRADGDLVCLLGLGQSRAYNAIVDVIAFPRQADPSAADRQRRLAAALLERDAQARFAALKGSIPVVLDARRASDDACAQAAAETLRAADLFIPHLTDIDLDERASERRFAVFAFQELHALAYSFWKQPSMSAAAMQAAFVGLIVGFAE